MSCTFEPLFLRGRCKRLKDCDTGIPGVEVPGTAVADVFIENQRLILGQYGHITDPRVGTVGQNKVDDPVLAPEGNCRLGQIAGQGS